MTRQERKEKQEMIDRYSELGSKLLQARSETEVMRSDRERERERGDNVMRVLNDVIAGVAIITTGAEQLRAQVEKDSNDRRLAAGMARPHIKWPSAGVSPDRR